MGNNKIEEISWEIQVKNQKKQNINILIQDQFPVSQIKDIEVEKIETGGGKVDEEKGIITWKFNIAPNQTKKTNFKYSVKYPKSQKLILE